MLPVCFDWREWLSPPTTAWWYLPLSMALLALLSAAIGLVYWPALFDGAIEPYEQDVVQRHGVWRLASLLRPVLLAILWLGAAACCTLGPRPPRVVVLQASNVAPDPTYWDRRVPHEHAGWSRIDARSLVSEVLLRVADDGAEQWYEALPSRRQCLRELCLQAIMGTLPSPRRSSAAARPEPRDFGRFPVWVVEDVELTIVQGLLRRENVVWIGIRADSDRSEQWERTRRLLGPARTRWQIDVDGTPRAVRVRSLFDGRREASGRVLCKALVAGPRNASELVTLSVLGPSGAFVAKVKSSVRIDRTPQIAEFAGDLPHSTPAGPLTISSERGDVRTWLVPQDTAPAVLAVRGPGAANLVQMWEAVRRNDDLGLEPTLRAQGRPAIKLVTRPPALTEPTLVLRPDAVYVLAPGLNPADIPGDALGQADLASSLTKGERNASVHVSQVSGGVATADSWMSVGLRTPHATKYPVTADSMRVLVGGGLMNQPLEQGRLLARDVEPIAWPLLETGRVHGRPFLVYRLATSDQGLLRGTGASTPEGYEPARARAFFASLSWAVERLFFAEAENAMAPSGPSPVPLLTASAQDLCTERGRRPIDAIALAAIGASVLAMVLRARSNYRNSTKVARFPE